MGQATEIFSVSDNFAKKTKFSHLAAAFQQNS